MNHNIADVRWPRNKKAIGGRSVAKACEARVQYRAFRQRGRSHLKFLWGCSCLMSPTRIGHELRNIMVSLSQASSQVMVHVSSFRIRITF